MSKKTRVRFAPSPTGGLHLGGVRTALYNYLFVKQTGGDFILRIEDTDQSRFVAGAEEYIHETLRWCGLEPDESPWRGGQYGPYRQSERKDLYRKYAMQLVEEGHAYFAFDTPEDLATKRKDIPNFQYNAATRHSMQNSLSAKDNDVDKWLNQKIPYVVRIKLPVNEEIRFSDMIRGEVSVNTAQVDDKVLLKADGMPTYHLAVVVDDFLMQISHAFRGEEWLPSAPVHVSLWKYLFGVDKMPHWAHLPLILKPDGNGKLSKRDGERLGFPVFAMEWTDPKTAEKIPGYREKGFLSEAFINMLALLGWNDGSGDEILSIDELIGRFSMERVHKNGAKFDYEKAKWFNREWIKKSMPEDKWQIVKILLQANGANIEDDEKLKQIIGLVKDRCTFLTDFVQQAKYFFSVPQSFDTLAIRPKWTEGKSLFYIELLRAFEMLDGWERDELEGVFTQIAAANQMKTGDLLLPLRIMLVGGKFGPGIFEVAELLGKGETISRIQHVLGLMQSS